MDPMSASPWRKASYSGNGGQNCVEVAANGPVLVRDTKDRASGPVLRIPPASWRRFTSDTKNA
jgi:hypothetical protein